MKKRYYVTYAFEGRLVLPVFADGIEGAKDEAALDYMDANLNEAETIFARPVIVEDEHGNIVWEA